MLAQPLAKTGRYLLSALGISKNTDSFFVGLNREITPVVNISPFIAVEGLIEFSTTFFPSAGFFGGNGFFNDATTGNGSALAVYGCTIFSDPLAAGESCELRPVVFGTDTNTPFFSELGRPDFASGVLESLCSGGMFFEAPVVLLPNWGITSYASTLSAGFASPITLRVLYSVLS